MDKYKWVIVIFLLICVCIAFLLITETVPFRRGALSDIYGYEADGYSASLMVLSTDGGEISITSPDILAALTEGFLNLNWTPRLWTRDGESAVEAEFTLWFTDDCEDSKRLDIVCYDDMTIKVTAEAAKYRRRTISYTTEAAYSLAWLTELDEYLLGAYGGDYTELRPLPAAEQSSVYSGAVVLSAEGFYTENGAYIDAELIEAILRNMTAYYDFESGEATVLWQHGIISSGTIYPEITPSEFCVKIVNYSVDNGIHIQFIPVFLSDTSPDSAYTDGITPITVSAERGDDGTLTLHRETVTELDIYSYSVSEMYESGKLLTDMPEEFYTLFSQASLRDGDFSLLWELPERSLSVYGYEREQYSGRGLAIKIGGDVYYYPIMYAPSPSYIEPEFFYNAEENAVYMAYCTGTGTGIDVWELYVFSLDDPANPIYIDTATLTDCINSHMTASYNTEERTVTVMWDGEYKFKSILSYDAVPLGLFNGNIIHYELSDRITVYVTPSFLSVGRASSMYLAEGMELVLTLELDGGDVVLGYK